MNSLELKLGKPNKKELIWHNFIKEITEFIISRGEEVGDQELLKLFGENSGFENIIQGGKKLDLLNSAIKLARARAQIELGERKSLIQGEKQNGTTNITVTEKSKSKKINRAKNL